MKNASFELGYNFNKRILFLLATILFAGSATAQSYTVSVEWRPDLKVTENGEELWIPQIAENEYAEGLPFFSWQEVVKKGNYSLSYSSVTTAPATPSDMTLISRSGKEIPSQPDVQLNVAVGRGVYYLTASVLPYIKENGQVKRITGFAVNAELKPWATAAKEKDYVTTSVLSSGDWYKISVDRDGVYKISRSFLEQLGIDVENLHPDAINIYGNASGRLSEKNNGVYFDDLAKNAIVIMGGQDGSFDDNDYILFYGAGPNRWEYSSSLGFVRDMHIYSDVNCYFIHIDAADVPLRVQGIAASPDPVTNVVTTYDYYDIHEVEANSLVGGGQRWYGELFDGELTQVFTFTTPNLSNESPVRIDYAAASNATSGINTLRFLHNNTLMKVDTLAFGGGDYGRDTGFFTFTASGSSLPITVTLNRSNAGVKAYLDFLRLNARRTLWMNGSQFRFRDVVSTGVGKTSRFIIGGLLQAPTVWDVTNPRVPVSVPGTLTGNQFEFIQNTDTLREFIAFLSSDFLTPKAIGSVAQQNLHGLEQADYIIVTHPGFVAQAQRLANLHEQQGTSTHVVTTTQIYNEYSSGVQDATAIRRFVKMFYDRANGDPALQPKHLLLFGDATYDPKGRVGNNNYMVPTYEVLNSENHIAALVTDDYFGLLDDTESINPSDKMDIGVGRLLVTTAAHANEQVNKIEHYMKNGSLLFSGGPNDCCTGKDNSTYGDWRLNYSIITDDEENGYFVTTDAEPLINAVQLLYPEMNYDKIYSDAYVQTSTAGGQRYPDVFDAITDRVNRGSLVLNYIGHGGEVGAAEERIITIPQILGWSNIDHLPLFVTATCEFTKFDDPSRVSAGEWIALNPNGGGIALMTTTRSVYFGVNSTTVQRFYENVFSRDANNEPLAFGEIMRLTKNSSGSNENRRSFNLIGDPALKIALPQWKIVTDSINGFAPQVYQDTVRALSKMRVKGHIEDFSGNPMTNFSGVLSPTIFDKARTNYTLGNDSDSPVIPFKTQNNALYKGKATVNNGYFEFEFIVPKDINYNFGPGKISYYANAALTDADGYDTRFTVGGIDTNALNDTEGPEIQIYLNDDRFVNGGITSQEPLLIVNCFDASGINTVGNGVGHDLIAVLDGNTSDPIVLNNYYTGNLDSYQSGQIQYTLKNLAVGNHKLEVKVWDVNNNSSVASIDFTVVSDENVQLDHVLNYPNPFTTKTTFYFEHNQSCSSLETQVQIYTVSGRLVRTINKNVATSGFRVEGIEWDGRDDFGDQLAKGVYVYRISVELPDGGKAEKLEKLVLLK